MTPTPTERVLSLARCALIAVVALPLAASCSVDRLLKSSGNGGGQVPVDPAVSPNRPEGTGQFRSDGVTPIRTGETLDETTVVIAATLTDPEPGDSLRLQVELRPVGVAFTGSVTHASSPVGNGARARIDLAIAEVDTAYVWQARTMDRQGRPSEWVVFNAAGGAFRFSTPRVPMVPRDLAQFAADGDPIPVGGTVSERDVFLRARVDDPGQSGEVRLEFEVRSGATPFTGTGNYSDEVKPGEVGSVKFRASAFVGYRWQARVCRGEECSAWVEFGGNPASAEDFFRDPFDDDDDTIGM